MDTEFKPYQLNLTRVWDLIRHTLLDVDTEFKPYQLNLTRVWDLIRHTLLDVGKGLIERLGCFVLS